MYFVLGKTIHENTDLVWSFRLPQIASTLDNQKALVIYEYSVSLGAWNGPHRQNRQGSKLRLAGGGV
jgi:hypothetical protein